MKLEIDVELNATRAASSQEGRGGRAVQVVLNFAADGGQQRFYDYVPPSSTV